MSNIDTKQEPTENEVILKRFFYDLRPWIRNTFTE